MHAHTLHLLTPSSSFPLQPQTNNYRSKTITNNKILRRLMTRKNLKNSVRIIAATTGSRPGSHHPTVPPSHHPTIPLSGKQTRTPPTYRPTLQRVGQEPPSRPVATATTTATSATTATTATTAATATVTATATDYAFNSFSMAALRFAFSSSFFRWRGFSLNFSCYYGSTRMETRARNDNEKVS